MSFPLRATAVLLFGLLALGGTSAYGQITNPSFEDGTGTDLSGITGWTTGVGASGAGGFSGARSTSWQTDGSYAVCMPKGAVW